VWLLCPKYHPQIITSRQLMGHDGGNPLKYQEDREGIWTLPQNAMECGIFITYYSSLLMERLRLPPHLGRDTQGYWGGNVGDVVGPL
jgi:hypothetical protein